MTESSEEKGQFELSAEEAAEKTATTELSWDLKDTFPDLFVGEATKLPKVLEKIWRGVVDDCIQNDKEGGSIHYLNEGAVIKLFFEKHDKFAGNNFIKTTGETLVEAFGNTDEDGNVKPGKKSQEGKKTGVADQALSNIIKQGITGTSNIKEFTFWAERTLQNIRLHNNPNTLPECLLKQAKLLTVGFFPFWRNGANAIVGNITTVVSSSGLKGEARMMQADIAILTAACGEAIRLAKNKTASLIIVPISLQSIRQKYFYEMYLATLRRINKDAYQYIVFELKDVPPSLSEDMQGKINELKKHCRGFTVNISILSPPRIFKMTGVAPQAYSVDLRGAASKLNEAQIVKHLGKFKDYYGSKNLQYYTRGVTNVDLARKAESLGYVYISGPAVTKPQRRCVGIKKIALEALLSNPNI